MRYLLSQEKAQALKDIETETNKPLTGATVYFEELEKGAITDFDGIVIFTKIPDRSHQI